MRKTWSKKEYVIAAFALLLFASVGFLTLSSIQKLNGNARVVNYAGIVRGATQKLVKEELMGNPDDELSARLDSIIDELLSGDGPNGLAVLKDDSYLALMRQVRQEWTELKNKIVLVRSGVDRQGLYDASQEYFELTDRAVSSAESYAETQLRRINRLLIGINLVFIASILAAFVLAARGSAMQRRASLLGKLAYIDQLTQINNRASCERLISRLEKNPPKEDIAVLLFDMNSLKRTNDALGHKSGDRIITKFARILKSEARDRGFVGRFGGDEFLAVFERANKNVAEAYLEGVRRRVDEYNALRPNTLEHIHFAVGCALSNVSQRDMEDIIHEADNLMYEDKRRNKMRDC